MPLVSVEKQSFETRGGRRLLVGAGVGNGVALSLPLVAGQCSD